jgi:HD superfamily phosphohydrolase
LAGIPPTEGLLVRLAALLHDIGHYPFSHALEEAGLPSHEVLAAQHLAHPELKRALDRLGLPDAAGSIAGLITGRSRSPLAGLISGSLDLDKIDYLTRDARMCGVPYGTVDVDRLIHSITLVTLPNGQRRVGVHEKGLSALESLTFAKYQMYRNVYWHHAVRSATCMFKRVVRDAVAGGRLDATWIPHATDEALMERLRAVPDAPLAERLRRRHLYKRLVDLPATEVPARAGDWLTGNPSLVTRVEDRLARELRLEPGGALLDFPSKPEMVAIDLPVLSRDGSITPTQLALEPVADALHRSARRLRLFAAESRTVQPRALLRLAEHTGAEMEALLEAEGALLA